MRTGFGRCPCCRSVETTRLVRLSDHSATRATERMRVDFVANASHELRTPLASLIGFIETLEDANGPDDMAPIRARFLGIMAGEARRMQRLVDDLISLSRIEADKHRAPADAIALGALVARDRRHAASGSRSGAATRIELASRGRACRSVSGDRAQLSQLLHNLLGNALKYGDVAKPVRVTVARNGGGMVRLAVVGSRATASRHSISPASPSASTASIPAAAARRAAPGSGSRSSSTSSNATAAGSTSPARRAWGRR